MRSNVCLLLMSAALVAGCGESRPRRAATIPPEAVAPAPAPAPVEMAAPAPPPKPMQTDRGRWRVSVASERSAEQTTPWVQKLEGAGYRVTTESADVDGTTWHRVVLPGYTLADARTMIDILAEEGMPNAWIVPRDGTKSAAAAPAAPAEAEPDDAPEN